MDVVPDNRKSSPLGEYLGHHVNLGPSIWSRLRLPPFCGSKSGRFPLSIPEKQQSVYRAFELADHVSDVGTY